VYEGGIIGENSYANKSGKYFDPTKLEEYGQKLRVYSEKWSLHHYFPCIRWEIRIVERPIELFFRNWLIGRVMVRREVWMSQSIGSSDPLPWVKDKHLFEQVNGQRVGILKLL
jgi:hypothetical protein